MTVRIGSLFAGIGGFELGIEAALSSAGIPHRTTWQVEQDEYCQQVLARHWPEARRYSDVRDGGAHNLSPVTVLLAGFPCTDISSSGNRAGLDGERSGLFYEVVRICREMAPRIVCLENVAAIHYRGLDAVLWQLAGLGYRVRYGNLRASDVGAPHRRERWFAVAWKVSAMADIAGGRLPLCSAEPERADIRSKGSQHGRQQPTEPGMGGSVHGVSCRLDITGHKWPARPGQPCRVAVPRTRERQKHDRQRIKALGNAIVPQCSALIGAWIASELLLDADVNSATDQGQRPVNAVKGMP